ncbi:mesothelin-like protein [Silurus meridionalis]|uniref:mesothelin-like protein n=1 Tax=Silurus meridionalis TaxID=175797 RepID=UPI001EEC1E82|nr:mesothelin-like protein [Silurus meridionalis]
MDAFVKVRILSSISTEEFSKYLNSTNPVINGSELCTLLDNYNRTTQYLEMEPVLSSALASRTLECVWPRALSASSQADVEQWFNVTLLHYLPYLSSQLISSTQLSGASCLSYRKLVSILGDNYTFAAADFTPADVYSSIKEYLSSGNGSPRCYNSSDPLLNSTAWFVDNIGFFITFITLTDLQLFLSGNMSSVFLKNSENLQLFNNANISASVLQYYTRELYLQNPDFSPLRLPPELLCQSPSSMFVPLGDADIQTILTKINNFCTEFNPEVTAVLVAKFPNITTDAIQKLGSQCVGLTVGQINSAPSNVLNTTLSTLSIISGWDQGQLNALIQSIISSGFNSVTISTAGILLWFSSDSANTKAKDLVKACRPRADRDKVVLEEAQLICMYNYVKQDPFVNFTDVPSDLLLYYSYEKIPKVNCQSYFSALGKADFYVVSPVLDKMTNLFNNAKDCLGISGVSLTGDQVDVLGNMACTLEFSYIQNSDPLILEKLKNCEDLSDSQITAIQSLLLSGNTTYGNPSTWNEQTVEQLGMLAVYFKSDLCNKLSFNVKRKVLSVLRKQKLPIKKLSAFFTECNSESTTVSKITAATIADTSFPYGFNSTLFDLYLDIDVLQDNLAAITEKVVDTSLQNVILNKLNQIYPSGLNDDVLQLLGSTSRVASIDAISKWNITIIDTLSSLLDSNDGSWEPEKSKAIIMRYLNIDIHSLGSAEINIIGSYICTLDINVLENITAENLIMVLPPDLTLCSTQQKSALYIIAKSSFINLRSNATTYYQLMTPYLGGAPVEDIEALSTQNINMDINIFISLKPEVLQTLNVSTVKALLGVNMADLKLFENSSAIQSWVSQQNQSDLDTLTLGLINRNPCYGVNSYPLSKDFASGNISAVLCNFNISDYACSSVSLL